MRGCRGNHLLNKLNIYEIKSQNNKLANIDRGANMQKPKPILKISARKIMSKPYNRKN